MIRILLLLAVLVLPLTACDNDRQAVMPQPEEIAEDTAGFYCGMLLNDHPGPKGQIHLSDRQAPLWFSAVRDAIAFTRMPGEARNIRAIYVNDMAKVKNWSHPEPGTWIDAKKAVFVIGSKNRGGMGAQEAIPFGDAAAAQHFVDSYGGRIVRLAEIPDEYVVGPPDADNGTTASAPSRRNDDHVQN
ncbi:MAG TPA: nitrous oxide reductase accessory protein NosL [Ferrovibrio sp.]|uniref:nitrous oxide reductase accessory protein NosL n=1 Tax=Ferrovibrio sp. TaxID=1917215 RepID=UPI002ED414E5